MAKYLGETDMSELEREFELEMEGEPADGGELEASFESLDDQEAPFDGESADATVQDVELEADESEFEDMPSGYAERFQELSQREFESESERDASVQDLMREMEADYFLGSLIKKGASIVRKVKQAAEKGGGFGLLKSVAQQLAGPLSGNLGALAKAALSAYPGGAALLPLLTTLGFDKAQGPDANKEAWNNFVSFSREAYDHLADNVGEREMRDPAAAAQRAAQALVAARQAAWRRAQMPGQAGFAGRGRHGRRPVYRVRVPRRVLARGLVIRIEVV